MEAEQQNLVQVPADLLKSLAASVENLQKDVRQLQNDNCSLVAEIELLKRNPAHDGPRFHLFLKLPVELRNIIWTMALTVPQIHIMNDELGSRSKVNTVMQACREARSQAMSLQLPYFAPNTCTPFRLTRQYMNPDWDTIWLADRDIWPEVWDMSCPRCDRFQRKSVQKPHHHIKRLALSFNQWEDPDETLRTITDPSAGVGSTDILRLFNGIEELLIVVGDDATIAARMNERDVMFINPTRNPLYLLRDTFEFSDNVPADLDLQIEPSKLMSCWYSMESRLEKILHHMKKRRGEMRKHEMEGKSFILGIGAVIVKYFCLVNGLSLKEIDTMEDFMDLEDWQVPKVRYVEAFTQRMIGEWFRPLASPY
jgi:hypothetical protein